MNRKRKWIVAGAALVLVIVVFAAGAAVSRPFGFHGKDFPKRFLERMDERVEKLNLTEAQQEKYVEIRSKIETNMTAGMKRHKGLFVEMKAEFEKEKPDMGAIRDSIKSHLTEGPQFIMANMDLLYEFYRALDEDRQAMVVERIREKMERCGPGGPGGPGCRHWKHVDEGEGS